VRFSIGEFAQHGRVSVRMLRHYDAIGLLRPAHVDPVTGYRSYEVSQLAELNRLIALKDLGFTLQQVRAILAERVSAAELRGMLRLRRAEIQARIEDESVRLARVEARLAAIEDEDLARGLAYGVLIKCLPPARVAELNGTAAGYEPEAITPVIQPLYRDLWQRMASAGVAPTGPAVAYYEDSPAGDGAIVVHAAVPVADVAAAGVADGNHGFTVVDLPRAERAAAIIHNGPMDDVLPAVQGLARWINANGYRAAGYAREVTLEWSTDASQWVTELQQPIDQSGG
jgi:DNA-binding transcriptional MerR regulator